MRVLLDTHAFLWWLAGDPSLSPTARDAIADKRNVVYVSAATAWEVVTKYRLGKLPGAAAIVPDVEDVVTREAFVPLAVTMRHAQRAGALVGPHRDPFDRMLVAQAIIENCMLISNETVFDRYAVARLW